MFSSRLHHRFRLIANVTLVFIVLCSNNSFGQSFTFPLKSGPDKRYLVDQTGKPFFLHGDAAWRISYKLTMKDAAQYITTRKQQGFNSLIIEVTPDLEPDGGDQPNIYGEHAFKDSNISRPNEKYFKHVDSVLAECGRQQMVVMLFPMYLGWGIDGWDQILKSPKNSDAEKCRGYGQWIGRRYKDLPFIIWASGGDHEVTKESIAIAEGIASVDPIHLHTDHTNAAHTSTEELPDAKWLTLSMVYTYFPAVYGAPNFQFHVYALLYREQMRLRGMPYFMAESAYENERNITLQFLRRQAYWSLTSGACGHYFGNRDTWQINDRWRSAITSSGAATMKIFGAFVQSVPWHKLLPDWSHSVVVGGRGTFNGTTDPGGEDYVTAAMTGDGKLLIAYLPTQREVTVNASRFSGRKITARWFDPSNGKYYPVNHGFSNEGVFKISPPLRVNGDGFDDWVLIVEAM